MLEIPQSAATAIAGHALAQLPEECCGLLIGPAGSGLVRSYVPLTNVAASSRIYTLDPREHLRAEREAEAEGLEVIGVVHSHTHTEAYPSPTDVAQAPDPGWHYVIVSLKRAEPSLRSYRIADGEVAEEPVVAVAG